MSTSTTAAWSDALRDHLAILVQYPAPRADLRSSLGKPPQVAHRVHRHIGSFVPDASLDTAFEQAVYVVAALAARFPEFTRCTDGTSVATALGRIGRGKESDTAFARLRVLTRSDLNALTKHLTGVLALCTSKGEHVDVARLARDLAQWDTRRDEVTRRWVREFDRAATAVGDDPTDHDTTADISTPDPA